MLTFTENERKRFRYEQIIRGKNKVIVRLNLGILYAGAKNRSEEVDDDVFANGLFAKELQCHGNTGDNQTVTFRESSISDGWPRVWSRIILLLAVILGKL